MEKNKEKRVIELELIDDVEDSGVSAVAVVQDPAIEKFWVYMKKHAFVYRNTFHLFYLAQ